jgi:hypothetical protein
MRRGDRRRSVFTGGRLRGARGDGDLRLEREREDDGDGTCKVFARVCFEDSFTARGARGSGELDAEAVLLACDDGLGKKDLARCRARRNSTATVEEAFDLACDVSFAGAAIGRSPTQRDPP